MSPKKPSSLDRYAELQPLIRKEAEDIARRVFDEQAKKLRFSAFDIPNHTHNGLDSPRIKQKDVSPGNFATGSVDMSESKRYRLGLTFNPTQMIFLGVAVGPNGERVQISAVAHFGYGYYFQPESPSSVSSGKQIYNVIQGGSWFWAVNGGTTFRSRPTQGHLTNIDSDGTTIVARATIPNMSTQASLAYGNNPAPVTNKYGDRSSKGYGDGFVYVDVTLATGWSIAASFIVS